MIGDLLMIPDVFDVRAHDRLLLLVDADAAENLHVLEFLVVVIFHRLGHRRGILLIENNLETRCGVV